IAAIRKMSTTAEGVETEAQRQVLKRLGCSEMQGYLFSPPKPAADVRSLFKAQRPPSRADSTKRRRPRSDAA
ncbi:EAL domain-containing protein, partial [Bradyrhizobium sp.]